MPSATLARTGVLETSLDGVNWEILGVLTDVDISHEAPETDAGDPDMDDSEALGAASTGAATPGTLSGTLRPIAASQALRDWEYAFEDSSGVNIWTRLSVGRAQLLGEQASGANATTIAIVGGTRLLTVAEKGNGNAALPANFGASLKVDNPPWRRGLVIEYNDGTDDVAVVLEQWKSSTTRRVSHLGNPDSNGVVTEDRGTALATLATKDAWKLYLPMRRWIGQGRVTGSGVSVSSGSSTGSIELLYGAFPTKQFLLQQPTY